MSGGFATPFTPPPAETPPPLTRLRALQRERRHLELRRIELQVVLADQERQVAAIAADAPLRHQGPVEAYRFARAAHQVARTGIAARATDQRLRRLQFEIAAAIGAVARTLRPR